MLCLTRRYINFRMKVKAGEVPPTFDPAESEVVITIPPSADPTVVRVILLEGRGTHARMGFDAPRAVTVARAELVRDAPWDHREAK